MKETKQQQQPSWATVCEHFGLDTSFQYSDAQQAEYYRLMSQNAVEQDATRQFGKMPETTKWSFGTRELLGGLLDYAERFADMNDEPDDGACREAIRKGQAWFENGTASVDPALVGADLVKYVERFADANDEPTGGNCRRLLECASETYSQRKLPEVKLVLGSNQDRNTILAALRFYQEHGMGAPANRSDAIHDIATNGGEDVSMGDKGIDDLCERINSASLELSNQRETGLK